MANQMIEVFRTYPKLDINGNERHYGYNVDCLTFTDEEQREKNYSILRGE